MIDGKTIGFVGFGALFLFLAYLIACVLFAPIGINNLPVTIFYVLGFIGSILVLAGFVRSVFGS